MNGIYIAITVIISLFLGMLLCIAGVFAYFLLTSVRQLQAAVEVMMDSLKPMLEEHSPRQIAEDLKHAKILLGKALVTLRDVIEPAMNNLTSTFQAFTEQVFDTKAAAKKQASRGPAAAVLPTRFEPEAFAAEGESAVYSHDEAEAALEEAAAALRKEGIEVDASRTTEPTPEEMTGADV